MSTAALAVDPARPRPGADPAKGLLPATGKLWFLVAVAGQWTFVWYMLGVYGHAVATWNFDPLAARSKEMLKGFIPGDPVGDTVFVAHVLMAAVLTFGGTLQLMPWIRARVPALHRWTGRVFLATATGAALAGLWMQWVRGARADPISDIGPTLDAVLILLFCALTLRAALAKDFDTHRRWAMRTFMVVNGVWFLRVMIIVLMLGNHALGLPKQGLDGPLFRFASFASYLIPLGVLELYQFAKARGGPGLRRATAALIVVATLAMGAGIVLAWLFMWSPVLAKS
ncbi:MAG: DUF2306 domain-containing protein [Proteobacteria bacterium]|nr:DUF2306 domain-containing protein [Pseudomonadota bacterium]